MRFVILPKEERAKRKVEAQRKWHKWFAWKPVRMCYDNTVVVFGEFILRRMGPVGRTSYSTVWGWQYAESDLEILKHEVK